MKLNGLEIVAGCMLENNNYFGYFVFYVKESRLLLGHSEKDPSPVWLTREELELNKYRVGKYPSLGVTVKDKNENDVELRMFDEIVVDSIIHPVYGIIQSKINDGKNYVLHRSLTAYGGWDFHLPNSKSITFYSRPTNPQLDTFEIKVLKNGKPFDGKISLETARNLGVVE